MEDGDLVHAFDDWELEAEDLQDKGKRPAFEDEDEEEEVEAAVAPHRGASAGAGPSGHAPSAALAVGPGGSHAGACARAAEPGDEAEEGQECAPPSPRDSEPGDMTCAICLGGIPLENLALVKGCDHMYCATCILHWALHREEPWCPQCKQPFTHLLTYRTLEGELQDFPSEELVCMLKRAHWFQEHLRFEDRQLLEETRHADAMAWQEYAEDYDLAEDEELEGFYFSSAAGRARVVLGNRRYGEGGFISGGRRQARPVVERKRSNKMGKSGEHAVVGTPPVHPSSRSYATPNAGGGRKARPGSGAAPGSGSAAPSGSTPPGALSAADFFGSSPGASGSGIYGSSPSGSGRRARRNARRAAMDAGMQQLADSAFGPRGGPRAAAATTPECRRASNMKAHPDAPHFLLTVERHGAATSLAVPASFGSTARYARLVAWLAKEKWAAAGGAPAVPTGAAGAGGERAMQAAELWFVRDVLGPLRLRPGPVPEKNAANLLGIGVARLHARSQALFGLKWADFLLTRWPEAGAGQPAAGALAPPVPTPAASLAAQLPRAPAAMLLAAQLATPPPPPATPPAQLAAPPAPAPALPAACCGAAGEECSLLEEDSLWDLLEDAPLWDLLMNGGGDGGDASPAASASASCAASAGCLGGAAPVDQSQPELLPGGPPPAEQPVAPAWAVTVPLPQQLAAQPAAAGGSLLELEPLDSALQLPAWEEDEAEALAAFILDGRQEPCWGGLPPL